MVGPPSQVEPFSNADCLPPATPEPSPPRFKLKPHKPKPSRSYEKRELRSSSSSNKESCQKPRRHNSEVSLSTIAEETQSQNSTSSMGSLDQQQEPGSVHSSLNGGTSVFLEPHITVETTTVPANVSFPSLQLNRDYKTDFYHLSFQNTSSGSSRCSSPSGQVTKVTATARFKMEVHTPHESSGGARPSSRSRSRRSSSGSSRGGEGSTQSSLNADSLRASVDQNSLTSSLSSDGGFSEK